LRSGWRRIVRWLPFLLLATLALVTAYSPNSPRKPFRISLDVSPSALVEHIYKPVHYRATAALFWLAVLAVGSRRIVLALALTLLLCVGIELAQGTVAGHSTRLADIPSYMIGLAIGVVVLIAARAIVRRVGLTPAGTQRSARV
jgi:hypothetical protein